MVTVAFSGVYYALPDRSFYHSTAMYERDAFGKDAAAIRGAVESLIRSRMVECFGGSGARVNGWSVNVDEMRVQSLDVGKFPEEFSFVVRAPLSYDKDGLQTELRTRMTARPGDLALVDSQVHLFIETTETPIGHLVGEPAAPGGSIFFPFKNSDGKYVFGGLFVLPKSLYAQIIDFGEGYRGFPTRVSGQYWRMLYFSAGVATSSALGDIVPLTLAARLLVTAQALVSVVLVGLFLNALAYAASGGSAVSNGDHD
jgi:hypothetical protein